MTAGPILVTGGGGQLASALAAAAGSRRLLVVGRPRFDFDHPATLPDLLRELAPSVIINAAAHTAVDRAETEPEAAARANRDGPALLAEYCARTGIPLIHISTDYVFDGLKGAPYLETDPTSPTCVYGATKLAGEQAVLAACPRAIVLRTSWVYAAAGKNFVLTMLRLGAERDALSVVADQIGCPTAAPDLAAAILAIVDRIGELDWRDEYAGVFHAAGAGSVSWHGFADAIFAAAARNGARTPTLKAITTSEYPTAARRPPKLPAGLRQAGVCIRSPASALAGRSRFESWTRYFGRSMNVAHPASLSEGVDLGVRGKPVTRLPAPLYAPSQPPLLTDVEFHGPGFYRLWHGLGLQGRLRFSRRVFQVGVEVVGGTAVDLVGRHLSRSDSGILRIEDGAHPQHGVRQVALYAHYCVSGRVSAMVLRQLRAYAAAGFAVVFVTMSPRISEADWAAVAQTSALLVHRRNHGLDFGAWREVLGALTERWPEVDELLLVNDSVLGPIRPLEPVFALLRSGGEGLFGLTDSCQGGAHLQSYFLLGRGRAAVMEMLAFLQAAPISTSKWLMVQRCEMGLSRHMHARGHRVAALYGYRRLIAAVNAHPAEGLAHLVPEAARRPAREPVLPDRPLNPVHHLWRPLVSLLGFPFLKIELVRRNPGRLPHIGSWTTLVGPDSPCPAAMLAKHLAEIGP